MAEVEANHDLRSTVALSTLGMPLCEGCSYIYLPAHLTGRHSRQHVALAWIYRNALRS